MFLSLLTSLATVALRNSPHPSPLPKERGQVGEYSRLLLKLASSIFFRPLPEGEGWGEGESPQRNEYLV